MLFLVLYISMVSVNKHVLFIYPKICYDITVHHNYYLGHHISYVLHAHLAYLTSLDWCGM